METVRPSVNDQERFKISLTRVLDPHFVDFLFASRQGKDEYQFSFPQVLEGRQHYRTLVSEKWRSGKRQLVSYEDGVVSFHLQEKEEDVDVAIILKPDGSLNIDGDLPISFLAGTLELARQKGSLSPQNLFDPKNIHDALFEIGRLTPVTIWDGVKCSLEIDPQGQLLIKGAYLSTPS